jgi:hypothetical protein
VGQKLSAISNPSQPGDMWSLNERPSLRFVTDAVRLTRQTSVTVEVTEIAASAAQGSDVKDDSEASLMDNMKGGASRTIAHMRWISPKAFSRSAEWAKPPKWSGGKPYRKSIP